MACIVCPIVGVYRLKLRRDVAITNLDIVNGRTKTLSEKERIYRE